MPVTTRTDLVVLPNSETPADRSIEKRRLRKHTVLNAIRRFGPISRADISKNLGYNLPSVSSLVDELISDGLVLEDKAREIPRGRRPIPVYLNENAASVVGIDVGKRSTIGLLVNLGAKTITRFEKKTPRLKSAKGQAEWISEVADALLKQAGPGVPPVCGMGVALPGLIHQQHARENAAIGEPVDVIRHAIQESYQVPVFIENDAQMMALGSYWFGQGKDHSTFVVINIGHGIGMGIFVDGKLYTGKQGFAGEIGFVPLGEKGIKGFYGHEECLENVASGAGLLRLAKDRGLDVNDAADIADLARKGNKAALDAFASFSATLGRAIATVVNLLDPEAVILSGRVCRSSDMFLPAVLEEARRNTLAPIFNSTRILVAPPDLDLGPLGAVAAVFHRIFHSAHVQVDEVI